MRINLWGAPGSGKSTQASRLFADLKAKGYNIELIGEYIKKWAYQKRIPQSFDQVYIFGQQVHAEDLIFQSGVEHLITDSPLLMQSFYSSVYQLPFSSQLLQLANLYEKVHSSLNIFLDSTGMPYQQKGRYETEEQSKERFHQMKEFLKINEIAYVTFSTLDYFSILNYIESFLTPKRRFEEGPLYGIT
jgi:thymidylate kinase